MADVELYKRHRPQQPSEMYGQADALNQIRDMLKRGEVPHFLLFTGPSGTGKTTLARMLAKRLGCTDANYREVNASESRGIDMVRELLDTCGMSPLGGKCKVYVIDEAQGLTHDAQSALLKPLEDGYTHVYFMLCTTDPQKIKPTVKTRATVISLRLLTVPELEKLVKDILAKEAKTLPDDIVTKIAEAADGSPRKALVILHQTMGLSDRESQIRSIGSSTDPEMTGFQLAQAIYRRNAHWGEICGLLQKVQESGEEPEKTRRIVLGYGRSILFNKGKGSQNDFARDVMDCFRFNYFDTGEAGLLLSCYEAVRIGGGK